MIKKILFGDIETTGLNPEIHGIHAIGSIIDIDGRIASTYSSNKQPFKGCKVEEKALKVSGITWNDIVKYPHDEVVFASFYEHVNVFADPAGIEKIYIAGYNSQDMERPFLMKWYERHGASEIYKSTFHIATLDVMVLAAKYFYDKGMSPVSYAQQNIADLLGISYDRSKLHNAAYDTQLTRDIYYKLQELQ